jgi:hypothetical protein
MASNKAKFTKSTAMKVSSFNPEAVRKSLGAAGTPVRRKRITSAATS